MNRRKRIENSFNKEFQLYNGCHVHHIVYTFVHLVTLLICLCLIVTKQPLIIVLGVAIALALQLGVAYITNCKRYNATIQIVDGVITIIENNKIVVNQRLNQLKEINGISNIHIRFIFEEQIYFLSFIKYPYYLYYEQKMDASQLNIIIGTIIHYFNNSKIGFVKKQSEYPNPRGRYRFRYVNPVCSRF